MHAGAGARQLKHIILTARHSREWSSLALQATEDDCHDARDEDDDHDPPPPLIIARYWTKALPAHLWRCPHLTSTPQCVTTRGVEQGTIFTSHVSHLKLFQILLCLWVSKSGWRSIKVYHGSWYKKWHLRWTSSYASGSRFIRYLSR